MKKPAAILIFPDDRLIYQGGDNDHLRDSQIVPVLSKMENIQSLEEVAAASVPIIRSRESKTSSSNSKIIRSPSLVNNKPVLKEQAGYRSSKELVPNYRISVIPNEIKEGVVPIRVSNPEEIPDEQSQAAGLGGSFWNKNENPSSSASNDHVTCTFRKGYEGSDERSDASSFATEETFNRESRNRSAKRFHEEYHSLLERRKRSKINKKMSKLQKLVPNCNKVDKASMLDDAINYLKMLQFQVQMMSLGNGLCLHPMMMQLIIQSQQLSSMMMGCNSSPFLSFPIPGIGMSTDSQVPISFPQQPVNVPDFLGANIYSNSMPAPGL